MIQLQLLYTFMISISIAKPWCNFYYFFHSGMQLCFVTSNWGICVGVRGRILMRVQGIPHKQDWKVFRFYIFYRLRNKWKIRSIRIWHMNTALPPHTVQKLIVIFDKLHWTFDFFISLYDMYACKKTLKKLIWTKKKNQVPDRGIEPGTAQIAQKQ